MPKTPGTVTSDAVLSRLLDLLWSPESGPYRWSSLCLRGLSDPAAGLELSPLGPVTVPALPLVTMFENPAFGFIGIELEKASLAGLASLRPTGVTVSLPDADGSRSATLTLRFGEMRYSGSYRVTGSALVDSAVGTVNTVLATGGAAGVGTLGFGAGSGAPNLDLAAWYRDTPLQQSDNGQVLVGMYYTHQATIQDVITQDSTVNSYAENFRTVMKTKTTVQTTNAVAQACSDYQQNSAATTTIGSGGQYDGGFSNASYLILATNQAIANGDPKGEYQALSDAMTDFMARVQYAQRQQFGTQPAGEMNVQQLMTVVANCPADVQECVAAGHIDAERLFIHPETGEPIPVTLKPLDREQYRRVGAARTTVSRSRRPVDVRGEFSATPGQAELVLSLTLAPSEQGLACTVTDATVGLARLNLELGNAADFPQQALRVQAQTWAAHTPFFRDLVAVKLGDALAAPGTLATLSAILTAGLRTSAA